MRKYLYICLAIAAVVCMTASSALACYAVVVGKEVSVDGSVLVGHNEQNTGDRFLNFRKVPRIKHNAGAVVNLQAGGHVSQVPETYAFLWSENPGIPFSDACMNEWGVAVVSDGCPDRGENLTDLEAQGQIRDGGIGYMLRRLIAQRAKTARQGVEIAGAIIDEVGYSSSRTLVIADSKEAWLFSMTRGKQWVAQRVPDDKVAILPNVYIIGDVDVNDKDNFILSPTLLDYALQKDWHNPADGPLNYAASYGRQGGTLMDPRQWQGQSMVTGQNIPRQPDRRLPFAVKPAKKLAIKDVIEILRNHDEVPLCSDVTQEAAVFQLRSRLPADIGCVYWRTSAEPCTSVLTPWYAGITQTPKEYYKDVDVRTQLTLEHHFSDTPGKFEADDKHAWWIFKKLQDRINAGSTDAAKKARATFNEFEQGLFSWQGGVDARALSLYGKDPARARQYLTEYCTRVARRALKEAQQMD